MEVRSDHDYYANIFAGSDYIDNKITIDTMSQWSVLAQKDTRGPKVISNYVSADSHTAHQQYSDSREREPKLINYNLGSVHF